MAKNVPPSDALIQPIFNTLEREARTILEPFEAETMACEVLAMMCSVIEESVIGYQSAALTELLTQLTEYAQRQGSVGALSVLQAMQTVAPIELRPTFGAAIDQLQAAEVPNRGWAAQIGRPVPVRCWKTGDTSGAQDILTAIFGYGKSEHGVTILLDHQLGGGIKDCGVSDNPQLLWDRSIEFSQHPKMFFQELTWPEFQSLLQAALRVPACPIQPDQIQDVIRYFGLIQSRAQIPAPKLSPIRTTGAATFQLSGPNSSEEFSGGASFFTQRADSRRAASAQAQPMAKVIDLDAAATRASGKILQLKVSLQYSKPPIWRRIEIPDTCTLPEFHEVLQIAFDWDDSHLHSFDNGRQQFCPADLDLDEFKDESKVSLRAFLGSKTTAQYTYDFGDNWVHIITVEKQLPRSANAQYPRCTGGRRASPPEDCGGVGGYEELLDALADRKHPNHAELLSWFCEMTGLTKTQARAYNPAEFDPAEITELLQD